jgi:rubrerythrin
MSIQLQIEEAPGYLAARFTGFGAAEEIWQRFAFIAERCKRANKNKLLLDIAESEWEASLASRFFLGDAGEVFLDYKLVKVAVLAKPEQLDRERFGEKVARNRWINTRVFTSAEEAEEWLLK